MSEDDLKNLEELNSKNKPRILTMYFEDGGETSVIPYDDYDDLQQENKELENINSKLSSALNSAEQRIDKAIEYIKNNTKYYDAEYSETYKELCDIAGANDTRIHVIVGDKELLSILKGEDKEC